MGDLWFLSPSDFLGRMPPAERGALLGLAQLRTYRHRERIFRAGSPGENVYLLADGRVKIFGLSSLGKEVILWFCFPGEVFGLAEMARGGPREVYAEACSDCRVHVIAQRDFKQFLTAHPATAMLVIDLLSCRLRVLGDVVQNLTADDVATRVVKLLLRLCARYGRPVAQDILLDIKLTHQEMADMIGATRQTVTAVMSELRRKGVLGVEDHHIRVRRPELLQDMAGATQRAAAVPGH